ncbi:MAG TPA: LPP20 family lipoprotein [Burkholderiales bacterium]
MKPIAIVLALGLLAGCASSAEVPDWVSGAAAGYPPSQYLLGRGEAESGEEARDRARADLAKVFEVQIAVESEDEQAFRTDGAEGRYASRSARRVSAHTERLLEGVEIAETWRDPRTHRYHALAVLQRQKAASVLRERIAELDAATRVQLERARRADDPLFKIAAAARAVAAQTERAGHLKTLRVVSAVGVGQEPEWSLERLRSDLDGLLRRVAVAPRVVADTTGGLVPVVQGAVAGAGFTVDTARPDYVLEASLALDDLGLQDGWYWQRGVLEVRLIQTGSERVRGAKRWPIKASALAREGAVKRALDQADAVLRKELRATVLGFAATNAAR